MRITIIPEDGFVSINGEGFSNLNLSFINTDIHAIQWYDTIGEIERKNKQNKIVSNETITTLAPYQAAIDLWQAKKNQIITETEINTENKYVPQSITRRQCAIELLERNLITPQETLNMIKYGDVPTTIAQIFSTMSDSDRINAEIDFAADTYLRNNPLLIYIMTSTGATPTDIDEFFENAATKITNWSNQSMQIIDQIKQNKIIDLTTEKNNLIAQVSEPYDAAETIYIEMIETQLAETISQINNSQSEEEINTITIQWIQFGV